MQTLIFLLAAAGAFLLLGLRLTDLIPHRRKTLRQLVKQAKKPGRNPLLRTISATRQILLVQGVENPDEMLLTSTGIAVLFGVFCGRLLGNAFLIPVLGGLTAALPMGVIRMRWRTQEKKMNDSLEAALSAVTTSYLRGSNTFLRAVEENVPQMPDPIRRVFQVFLLQANLIDTSLTDAMDNMILSVHNDIFVQWMNAVLRCQQNQTLKSTLPGILDKFSEQRTVAGELEILMAEPKRTFYIMIGAAAASPVLLLFLNRDWWTVLVTTALGKGLLAGHVFAIAVALVIGLTAMNPDYRLEESE